MSALPRRFANLIARHPRLAALLAGALVACGFRPLGLWPLALLALAALIALVARATTARRAFAMGWLFGVGLFAVGNNWIATAFTYQAEMPAWLGGIAVVLLSFYLALFPALAVLAGWLFAGRLQSPKDEAPARALRLGLALAPAWLLTEWMRGWVFTGFAWNPLGVLLLGSYETPGLALLAPFAGTYALSGLVILIAACGGWWIAVLADRKRKPSAVLALAGASGLVALGLAMSLPAGWLARPEGAQRYTLVQPDIRQERIDDPAYFESNFQRLAALTPPRVAGERRLVFWPESGLADYLREGLPPYLYRMMTYASDPAIARRRIGRVIGPYSILMTGAVDIEMQGGETGHPAGARNTVTMIDGKGAILASYSKAHLVPYGEYLALRWLLEPLGASRLVAGSIDFWPGPGPLSYDLGAWGKAGVQICYEIVFPGEVVDRADRPDFIFNPSNDGWFGSWGPPQHLAQARLRAIEEGLPVIRATTTGISAVIDGHGLVRAHIDRHRAGRLDGHIPPPLPPTLFARWGNVLSLLWAAVWTMALVVASAIASRRGRV